MFNLKAKWMTRPGASDHDLAGLKDLLRSSWQNLAGASLTLFDRRELRNQIRRIEAELRHHLNRLEAERERARLQPSGHGRSFEKAQFRILHNGSSTAVTAIPTPRPMETPQRQRLRSCE